MPFEAVQGKHIKIAFLCRDSHFRYGLASIIAVVKQYHYQCDLFIAEEEKHFINNVEMFKPDVVAFACTSGEHRWLLGVAKEIKNTLDCLILVGGPHPTFFPELIENPQVDIICIGEGEFPTLDLLNRLDKKEDFSNIENFWVRKNSTIIKNPVRHLIADLNTLPFVDRDCYDKYSSMRNDTVLHILAERGCPYNCSYCYNPVIKEIYQGKGRFYRQTAPQRIIEEIKMLIERYPRANVVRFYDDLFVTNKKRLFELLDMYKKEIKLPFICNVTANFMTEEVVMKLKDCGCTRACIGIETGNEEYRKEVLKKQITNKQLLDAAEYCQKHKLRLSSLNMIGMPNETIDNAIETVIINHRMKVETPINCVFQPYPRTPIAEYSKEKGLLDENFSAEDLTPYFFYGSVLKQKNIKELVNLLYFFWFIVKYPVFIPLVRLIIKLPATRFHLFFFSLPILIRKIKYGNYTFFQAVKLLLRRIIRAFIFNDSGLESRGV